MNLSDRAFNYYRYFIAIKLHFKNKKYNFFQNAGKTNASVSAFNGRNDRYFFEKMAKVFNTEKFLDKCLTEVKKNRNFSSRDLFSPDNESRYLKRKGYLESFKSSFDRELSEVVNYCLKNRVDMQLLLQGTEEQKPHIYLLLQRGVISEETYLCFDRTFDVSVHLAKFSLDPLVTDTEFFLQKYYPFVAKYFPRDSELQNILSKSLALLG
jgi:hypothetical protein